MTSPLFSGPPFSGRDRLAVLVVGIVGVLIPGLQPQLLGALAHEGRLSASALGLLATIELLAMGVAAGAAGFVLPIARLRPIAIVAVAAAALIDLATPLADGAMLLAARAAAGLAEGVLIWIAIGLIVRMAEPARWSGLYLFTQTLAQLALATLLGLYVIPTAGSRGGFEALGIATLLGLAAIAWLPRGYPPLGAAHGGGGLPPARGLVALAAVLLYLAFIVAVWVYVEPIGLQRGIGGATLGMVAPLSLAMQVLGAGAATLIAGRVPALPVVMLAGAANLALLWIIGAPPSPAAFVAATAAFGFLWLFVMPFQIPIVIAADPSRRTATLVGGAQLIGSSLGPLLAAELVTDADVTAVLWFGAACIVLALLLSILAGGRRHFVPEPA